MTDSEFLAHIDKVSKNYKGDSDVLISAVGSLMVGRIYGWRVLRIIVSNPSYIKYQRILGLEFKSVLPEETEHSNKSIGYKIVKTLNNFWQVVRGQSSIDSKDKRRLENCV